MKTLIKLPLHILAAVLATQQLAHSQDAPNIVTYDLSRDFSLKANPNGVWSYGWKASITGAFTALSSARTAAFDNGVPAELWELAVGQIPAVFSNRSNEVGISDGGNGTYPPGTVWVLAGFDGQPQNFGVIRFTVPNGGGGLYRLESSARSVLDGAASKDADLHIILNGEEVFSNFLPPLSATGYTNTFTLFVGDTIDFAVGRGADGVQYGSGLKLQATLTTPVVCTPHKAKATAQTVNGFVVGATVIDRGCGYTNAPTVLIQGGGGNGATAAAEIMDGKVTKINIISAGCCYTNLPSIVIGSPPFVPKLTISVSKVKVSQDVVLGRKYLLESSKDLATWTATAPAFIAESETVEGEFDVDLTGRFFRIREVP